MSAKFGGLLTRKERWGLSWRGWGVLTALVLLSGLGTVLEIHPFLAVTHRVSTRILVVEGWVDPFVIKAAVNEFKRGDYDRVFTTGGPVVGTGGYSNKYNTEASVGANELKAAGLPSQFIQMVPSHDWKRNRTYYSAVALRNWFKTHHLNVRSFNVLTEDAHARRTWLLFQDAFGKKVQVGIISVPNPDYNPKYWWKYSEGVREVINESIAYVYAKFIFWP